MPFLGFLWTFCGTVKKLKKKHNKLMHEDFLLMVLSILVLLCVRFEINNILKPDPVSVITVHLVYFSARSEIFQKTLGN